VEDEILRLLREHAAGGQDQGLTVLEIAERMGADPDAVLAVLQTLSGQGLAYKESFWWYPDQRHVLTGDIDQR
jgi:DNA-binding IclR family transcriptional regulator